MNFQFIDEKTLDKKYPSIKPKYPNIFSTNKPEKSIINSQEEIEIINSFFNSLIIKSLDLIINTLDKKKDKLQKDILKIINNLYTNKALLKENLIKTKELLQSEDTIFICETMAYFDAKKEQLAFTIPLTCRNIIFIEPYNMHKDYINNLDKNIHFNRERVIRTMLHEFIHIAILSEDWVYENCIHDGNQEFYSKYQVNYLLLKNKHKSLLKKYAENNTDSYVSLIFIVLEMLHSSKEINLSLYSHQYSKQKLIDEDPNTIRSNKVLNNLRKELYGN